MLQTHRQAEVMWALAYPFDVPACSFVYIDGETHAITSLDAADWRTAQVQLGAKSLALEELAPDPSQLDEPRIAVIACGSNASPQRLVQKYAHITDTVVPTLRVTLHNYCVVYAAKYTEYGSIPATLLYVPGAQVEVFVNFLTLQQLQIMDGTETLGVSYNRPVLEDAIVELDNGARLSDVHAYISRHGCLTSGGEPIVLSTVDGKNVPFRHLAQGDVQVMAFDLLQGQGSLDTFIFDNISKPELRRARSETLSQHFSIPAGWTG